MSSFFDRVKGGFKSWGLKIGIGFAVISLLFGAYKAYQAYEAHIAKEISDAHTAGRSEANADTVAALNAAKDDEAKRVAAAEAATNAQIADIRQTGVVQHQAINNYDADTIAVAHPEAVEKWANDTTNGIFAEIQEITK
jgi:hypothetical protein